MDVGAVEIFEPLNSFFNSGDAERRQTEKLREIVGDWKGPGTLVLVTHQVNVTPLTVSIRRPAKWWCCTRPERLWGEFHQTRSEDLY